MTNSGTSEIYLMRVSVRKITRSFDGHKNIIKKTLLSDPCIPDVICGLDLFYFILMFLPIVAYLLFFTGFLAPYWAKLSLEETGHPSFPHEYEMGIWQTCSYFPLEDDSSYHGCTMIESLPGKIERNIKTLKN